MIKSSLTATIAAILAVLLAIYEAFAVIFGGVTITDFLEEGPEAVELVVIGGVMVWLAVHFKWFSDLLKLLGK